MDGSAAYDQIFEGEKEWYLFPDGKRYTKPQFLAAFMSKLNLTRQDTVMLDRSARFDLLQPVFQSKGQARLIFIMHARHFYKKGEDFGNLINTEYYYCFKYSGAIDTIVVSTKKQKEELVEKLTEYQCSVPEIAVIPAGGVDCFRHPETKRRPYSLISVSRIAWRKKIDWLIKSVIKVHRVNPYVSLDIYGEDEGCLVHLQKMISQNQAQSYIRFMGWMDVTEVYKNYEVYLTASLGESFGLSLLEANASGTAMIGLDVEYGNRVFIRPEVNGYLVDFDTRYLDGGDEELTDAIAKKIIEIFSDEERLERFHQQSYEIAKSFSSEIIAEKWKNLLLGSENASGMSMDKMLDE